MLSSKPQTLNPKALKYVGGGGGVDIRGKGSLGFRLSARLPPFQFRVWAFN